MDSNLIKPNELKPSLKEGKITLVDVREPDEYREGHLKKSINLPVSVIIAGVADFKIPKRKPVVTICAHGVRSLRMQQLLSNRGYDVKSLDGGMTEWEKQYGKMDTAP